MIVELMSLGLIWEPSSLQRLQFLCSCWYAVLNLLHVQNSSSRSNHHICIPGDTEDWGQRRFPETAAQLIRLYFKSHCINVWPHLAARKARTVFFILAVNCWVLLIRKKVRMSIRADSHQSVSACQLDAYSNTNSSSGLLLFLHFIFTISWMKVQSNETLLCFTLHHVTSITTVMNWEDKR